MHVSPAIHASPKLKVHQNILLSSNIGFKSNSEALVTMNWKAIPEVISQKDADQNGVLEPFFSRHIEHHEKVLFLNPSSETRTDFLWLWHLFLQSPH
jgi:hypothetical protein